MSLRQLNKYSNVGHVDVDAMFATLDVNFKGRHGFSFTNFNNAERPSIAAGSVIYCNGAVFIADIDEEISGNPPDGVVYCKLIPSGSPVVSTAAFTEVAPTWNDDKQGWYSPTAGEGNHVYIGGCHKSGTLFTGKGYFDNKTPVGHVKDVLALNVRFPYILAYGQAVSRTQFAVLFAEIGTVGGSGDGYSTFNIPDLRGRECVGLDNMGGASANRMTDAAADVVGGTGGSDKHQHNLGYGQGYLYTISGSYGISIESNMDPFMAVYKAVKFI